MATDAIVATTTALLPRLPLQPAPLLQLPATDPHIFQKQKLMFIGLLLIVANPHTAHATKQACRTQR